MHETIREIKSKFRLFMNGVISQSLREKGLQYRLIFGIELPRIKEIAAQYEPNHELAQALWKEDIRECKILAAYLQPVESFYPEIADIWMEQIHNTELADYVCMALFRRLPYASQKAFQWMASENRMEMYMGFRLMTHLFALLGATMNERSRDEFIDQATAAMRSDDLIVKQAAHSALERYAACNEASTAEVEALLVE
ncbi:MAG: DNA alkylation repair protein [Bacteroidales bacterium]|nr:DNA alkylation repair protein [Bacteroidales bacterium]